VLRVANLSKVGNPENANSRKMILPAQQPTEQMISMGKKICYHNDF
jgi:hypothetical protein